VLVFGIRQEERPADQRHRDHRQIHEEDRVPLVVFQQQPADDRPHTDTQPENGGPDGNGLRAFFAREGGADDGERRGHDGRAADAQEGAGRDQHLGGRGQGGPQRSDAEHHQAELQGFLAPDAVANRAHRQQQRGKDQHIGIDDPLQIAGRGAEIVRDRGKSDVEDGVVQADHDQRNADEDQADPPPGIAGRVLMGSCDRH